MKNVKLLAILYTFAISIIASGIAFSIYSFLVKNSFLVLRTQIPGTVFGLVFIFLGIRYFRSLQKFSRMIKDSNLEFSWQNIRNAVKKAGKAA